MTGRRPGLPVLAGSAALGLALLLAVAATPRWQHDTAEAERALAQRASLTVQSPTRAPVMPAEQWLVQALPVAAQLPQRAAALVQIAQRHGVQIDSVRQSAPLRLGQGQGALAAERVPLRLTGTGAYTAWRRFAAEALQHDDALALTDLRLSRNGPADRMLAGTLQWSLLQRLPEAAAAAGPAGPAAAGVRR
jgi:hypothetical protein